MITILHGDNIVASRNRLNELRQQVPGKEVLSLASPIETTMLMQALESASLFGTERLVIIENLLSRLGRKRNDEALEYLSKGVYATDCILWESKPLPAGILALFPKGTRVELFKLSKSLFRWLDSLRPKNTSDMLRLFHASLAEEETELLFAMLVRQVRLLLALSIGANTLEEVVRLAPWQRGKLQTQASLFQSEELMALHKQLYIIDKEHKTGQNALPLSETLDILLTEI